MEGGAREAGVIRASRDLIGGSSGALIAFDEADACRNDGEKKKTKRLTTVSVMDDKRLGTRTVRSKTKRVSY